MKRLLPVLLLLAGCGWNADHQHAEGDDHSHERAEAVVVDEGAITLSEETAKHLEVRFAEAERRAMASSVAVNAEIVTRNKDGSAKASAVVSKTEAQSLKEGLEGSIVGIPESERIARIAKIHLSANGLVEVILDVKSPAPEVREIRLSFSSSRPETAVVVPKTAVLKTVEGTIVFVKQGHRLVRTEVKTGRTDGEAIEVVEGIREGELVVTHPVKRLWLAELHSQRGGEGHAH